LIQQTNIEYRSKYGILYESYHSAIGSWTWWICIVLIRQVVLISLSIIFQLSHLSRYLSFCYYLAVLLALIISLQPNQWAFDNRLETAATALLLIIASSMMKADDQPPLNDAHSAIIALLVLPFAILLLILVILIRLRIGRVRAFLRRFGVLPTEEKKVAGNLSLGLGSLSAAGRDGCSGSSPEMEMASGRMSHSLAHPRSQLS
jgi:hypothetical protein